MSDTHAQTVSYVRTTMLPEQAPPALEQGVVKWMRENLFSSWLNVLLTAASIIFVYYSLSKVVPWAFGGVWNAGSLTECREVLFAFYKGSHDGACWAVIEDRWLQLLFGFYPPELYWRPILAFVLLFVALAPILFADKVSGKMIYFSLAYPFLATWLIWGGSFWTPVFVAAGFVIAFFAQKLLSKVSGPIVANLGALVAALVWWMVLMAPISDGLHKIIGASRIDATVARLEASAEVLPEQIAEMEALGEEQQAVIAEAVAAKDATLAQMMEIRDEEFAVEAQLDAKQVALKLLEGTDESLVILARLLDQWDGSPAAAAEGETNARALAAAESAQEKVDNLIRDINRFLGDAQSDLTSDTAEPSEVADLLVSRAAQRDPSILDDVGTMVDKATLVDPIAGLVETAAGLTDATSQNDIASMRVDVEIAMAGLSANIDSLQTVYDKVVATNVDDLAQPQARLLEQMAGLTALRDQATVIAQDTFRVTSINSANRSLLSDLNSLDGREAELPALRETEASLRAALPRSDRGMININQLGEDASDEQTEALGAYLDARSAALAIEGSVRDTYAEIGRVGLQPIDSRQIGGFMLGVIIGVAGIVLSLPLGILLALGRQSHLFIVNKVCVAFIEVIRGVPLIVWLITASLLLNYFLPPGSNFDLVLRVIIMVTLFASAYIAEVIRGGLAALPTGQYEGADSLGLSYWQSMQLIVLPQAMKISIPGIVNTFIGLFKDTTLVVFIGLLDPIGLAGSIRADTDWNGVYWELFIFIGALFFIFCFSMGRYSLYLEKKLQREHR